jgi:hypothetical protein
MVGSCEHGNKPSGSLKAGEFPDELVNYHIMGLVSYFSIYDLMSAGRVSGEYRIRT